MLHGRSASIALIDSLLAGARDHRSGSLLLHGEAGIGKSALLEYARSQAGGHDHRARHRIPVGIELLVRGPGQIVGPLTPLIDRLPEPQARALQSALGLRDERVRDRLLVFAALLSLLAEAAEKRPTCCLVDDIQWADQGSVDALAFAARRLNAEGVAILMARRTEGLEDSTIRGLPDQALERLGRADALALLRDRVTGSSAALEKRLIEASAGNPLALVEFPRVLDGQTPAAAEWPHDPLPLTAKISNAFLEQSRRLSANAQTILVVSAADPESTLDESRAVAAHLGAEPEGFLEAEASGLVQRAGARLEFRHPLIRAAGVQPRLAACGNGFTACTSKSVEASADSSARRGTGACRRARPTRTWQRTSRLRRDGRPSAAPSRPHRGHGLGPRTSATTHGGRRGER